MAPDCTPGTFRELCQIDAGYSGIFELAVNPADVIDQSRLFAAKVRRLEEVANGVLLLKLYLPPNTEFSFLGGQFASVIVNSELQRSYSIANYNPDLFEFDFYIKKVAGGRFSQWLLSARPGSLIRLRSPIGTFHLSPSPVSTSYFLATGTGIVPIYAMLKLASEEQLTRAGKIYIVWGNRTPDDLFLVNELEALAKRIDADLKFAFSRFDHTPMHYVTDCLMEAELQHGAVYAAGHPTMVKDARRIALQRSVDPMNFHSDAFAFSESKETNL
jgi:CDP-4-dehydro-6-deoxyglucose reductase